MGESLAGEDKEDYYHQEMLSILRRLESSVAEMAGYTAKRRRFWARARGDFAAGVVRGLGMAFGFTLLGALVIYLLQKMAVLNLPLLSGFIAELVKMVQQQMH